MLVNNKSQWYFKNWINELIFVPIGLRETYFVDNFLAQMLFLDLDELFSDSEAMLHM